MANRPPPKKSTQLKVAGARISNLHTQTIDRKMMELEEKNVLLIQNLVKKYLARRELARRKKFADKRTKIVRELLETERTYVKGLNELVKLFEEPSAQKHLLPPEDHKIIFSTIGTILNCNTKVLELLEQRFLRWQPASTVIGDIFLQFSDFLKASTTHYASLYNESINKLVEYTQKKSDFGSYCKDTFAKGKTMFHDLSSYLITPVQRVPRYNLLLTDILKNTWPDHQDYPNIQKAIDKIRAIAEYLNQKGSEAENSARVFAVQNNLVGKFESFIDPHRRHVRDGELTMIRTEGEKREKKRRYFILFNDTLVCAQPPKKPTGSISKSGYAGTMKYKFESKIMFKEMSVVPEGPPDIPFSFILNTPKASLMLSCSNAAEKHAWLEDIKAVVREHQQQDAFHEKHRDQIASQRAEQAKAILAEKYTAIRLSNTVDTSASTPGRYDSLRRHKQQALAGGAAPEGNGEASPNEGSRVVNTFHKMTASERMQMLSDAQEKLEKMLQAEKQQIDDTKREINNRFGSMTTPGGARPSYKEIQQQRRDTKKKETAAAIGAVPATSDEQLFNELEKKLATGKMEFGGSFPSVSHSPKSTKQELRNTFS